MNFPAQTFLLHDGRVCTLRSPLPEDAPQLLAHLIQVCGETRFLLREPSECNYTLDQEAAVMQKYLDAPRAVMLSVWLDGRCVANASVDARSRTLRAQHRAVMGLSVQKAYWRQGIGSQMLRTLIACARDFGYMQLELEAVADNEAALALYRKYGFIRYGTRPRGLRYADGSFADEILMSLTL